MDHDEDEGDEEVEDEPGVNHLDVGSRRQTLIHLHQDFLSKDLDRFRFLINLF